VFVPVRGLTPTIIAYNSIPVMKITDGLRSLHREYGLICLGKDIAVRTSHEILRNN